MGQHRAENELVSIGAVVESLRSDYPDISHSSLRFLEREGLIVPTRTPGGHRLYSVADLRRVRQIKDWQAQRLTLDQIRQRLAEREAIGTPAELAATFLNLALAGYLSRAQQSVRSAYEYGLSLDLLFLDVLRPALWDLGRRWQREEVSVAQEKEVSHVARDLIAELGLRSSSVTNGGAGGVVAACVAGERHELGLLMLSGLLRARGISVHVLGADVAPGFLAEAVTGHRPLAVLLSVTSDEHVAALRAATEALRGAGAAPRILAGGQAVQRHPEFVTNCGVTPIIADNPELIDELAHSLRDE